MQLIAKFHCFELKMSNFVNFGPILDLFVSTGSLWQNNDKNGLKLSSLRSQKAGKRAEKTTRIFHLVKNLVFG